MAFEVEFSKRLDLFGAEIFAALNDKKVALEAQGKKLYNLSVGTPDFEPMPHIKQALCDAAMVSENWKYVKEIPDDVADKAKMMIVSLPANPVGSVGSPELYQEIVDFCNAHKILLIHDNAYSDIIFDGAVGHSIFNIPGAETCAVEFFSLSKSFNVTGARISFLVGRRDVIAACKKLRTQIDFGKFIPEQKAAIAAMTGPLEPIKAQCAEYQRRRDALCGGFRSIGWDVPDSHGSMFVWAPVPQGHGTSMEFCMEMIEKAGVICTPGSSFGPSGEGYVRFALTLPVEKITEAVQAVKNSGLIG